MLFLLVACFAGASIASAAETPEDERPINQCLADKNDPGVTKEVLRKYCVCMDDKMDDKESETQTVAQWEKTHPKERAACARKAGLKLT